MRMSEPACSYQEREETAAGFAAGALSPREHEAFSLHLLSCAQCRALLQDAAALRAGFRTRDRRRRRFALPVTGVAAALIAWVALMPSAMQRLGREVEPPDLRVMAVRANPDSAAHFAERGIAAYNTADYQAAADAMGRAYTLQPDAGTAFVLGAALLLAQEADSARAALTRAVDAADSPYQTEARLYRAYAWLQLDQADSAIVDLQALQAAADPPMQQRATLLLERIRRAQ